MKGKKKIALVLNTAWNIFNFRQNLVKSLIAEGYEVLLIAPEDDYVPRLKHLGCRFIPIHNLDKRGTNPIKDLQLFLEFRRIFKSEKPDLILNFTIKPNIFSSLAARQMKIKTINTVTGRGRIRLSSTIIERLIKMLYKVAFSSSELVVFQNMDDKSYFRNEGLVEAEKCLVVPGSGVDLTLFQSNGKLKDPLYNNRVVFLLVARLMLDKGIREYAEAARIARERFPDTEFWLLGPVDDNPNQITEKHLRDWEKQGVIKYLGVTDNVQEYLTNADVIVLPSYYGEGVPRTLLESLAMEKPIVTTNHTGCKETVDEGENGYLVPVKDIPALAKAMTKMIEIGEQGRKAMGKKSREKAEREFDDQIVIDAYLKVIREILN